MVYTNIKSDSEGRNIIIYMYYSSTILHRDILFRRGSIYLFDFVFITRYASAGEFCQRYSAKRFLLSRWHEAKFRRSRSLNRSNRSIPRYQHPLPIKIGLYIYNLLFFWLDPISPDQEKIKIASEPSKFSLAWEKWRGAWVLNLTTVKYTNTL